jgi:hypothetical protein
MTLASRGTILTLLVVASVACHSSRPDMNIPPLQTHLVVNNGDYTDYNIYLITTGGQPWRLGFATGLRSTTFVIPTQFLPTSSNHLRFRAEPIARDHTAVGEEIVVAPGDEVDLRIQPM